MISFSQNLSCLFHGKSIALFRFIYTFSTTVARSSCKNRAIFAFYCFYQIREMLQKNLVYSSLSPSLFIEIHVLSQEESFTCVLGISILPISTIFLYIVGTVPTVGYLFFHFVIGYELQLSKKRVAIRRPCLKSSK